MNVKLLGVGFKEKKIPGGWVRKIPGVYRLSTRWIRFKRACNWFVFIYNQPNWQEYESLVAIIRKRLLDMAVEFETKQITTTAHTDARDMRLTAELLHRFAAEYYQGKYWDEAQDPKLLEQAQYLSDWDAFLNFSTFKEGYNHEYVEKGREKDMKALRLAFKIMSEKLPGWWQ